MFTLGSPKKLVTCCSRSCEFKQSGSKVFLAVNWHDIPVTSLKANDKGIGPRVKVQAPQLELMGSSPDPST